MINEYFHCYVDFECYANLHAKLQLFFHICKRDGFLHKKSTRLGVLYMTCNCRYQKPRDSMWAEQILDAIRAEAQWRPAL